MIHIIGGNVQANRSTVCPVRRWKFLLLSHTDHEQQVCMFPVTVAGTQPHSQYRQVILPADVQDNHSTYLQFG